MFGSSIPPAPRRDEEIEGSWLEMLRKGVLLALGLRVEPPLEMVDLHGVRVLRLAASLGDGSGKTSIPIRVGTGGIPALVGTTAGKNSTTVKRLAWVGDTLPHASVTTLVTVYNLSTTPIPADRYGKADWTIDRWVIDVASCTA